MDDNDEIWATEADHRTGWNETFRCGTYRGMLYGVVLRDYPRQVVFSDQSKERSYEHARVLLLGTTHRIYVTTSTAASKTGWLASTRTCPSGCQEFSHKGSTAHSIRLTCKICGTVRKEDRHPQRQEPATCFIDTRATKRATHNTRQTSCVIV